MKSAIAGIDLGTTYSALAVFNQIGKPEIVPDTNGNRITPSMVAFEEGGRCLVGLEAKNKLKWDPTAVVQFVKRKMGDPSHVYSNAPEGFGPVQISSLILKKLKEDCVQLGEVKDVVITVPAHFSEVERKSTMDAGALAGLNVLGTVNEPTAAAIYYAKQSDINGKVLVFDLGGGTFDVTVLQINDINNMDILASKGDGHLGGADFDNELTRHFIGQARKEHGKEFFPDSFFEVMPSEHNDASAIYFSMMEVAERAKKKLSVRDHFNSLITTPQGDQIKVRVTREEFEEMISSYLSTTELLIENVLEDASLSTSDINKVILVGGSSRIPKVSEMLEGIFGFPAENSVNLDEAVALGAAIMAGKRTVDQGGEGVSDSARQEIEKISVDECANKFFGTFSIGRNEARGENEVLQNSIIIQRGTKLPCRETEYFATCHDGQKQVEIEMTESEEPTTDPDHVHNLGSYLLELPPDCPAGSPIKITYGYDENQRLDVHIELPNGKIFEGDLSYDDAGNLKKSEIKEAAAKIREFTVE